MNQQQFGASCDIQAKGMSCFLFFLLRLPVFSAVFAIAHVLILDFTKCLEATNGDMQSCGYYLEALSTFSFPSPSIPLNTQTIETCVQCY